MNRAKMIIRDSNAPVEHDRRAYDIFISYRRDGGFETASLITERLRNAGYSVFFDVESLKSGKFNEQLYQVIDGCRDFVLILPEKGLDRCVHHDDWVRLEIERAQANGKNIIPVLLRGFEWPKPMLEGLEELSNYQAVAAGSFEYFDASIQRLRDYLKSKPGLTWRRHRKHLLLAAAMIVLVTGSIAGWNSMREREFAFVCQTQSASMGLEIAKVNQALTIASQAKDDWDKYWKNFPALHPQDTSFARRQFMDLMDHRISNLEPLLPAAAPGEETISYLARKGVRTDDLIALYSTVLPVALSETRKFIGKLRTYAGLPVPSPTIDRQLAADYRVLELGAKLDYVGYLELVAAMPKQSKDDAFYELRLQLDRFRDVPTELSAPEYEQMGQEILHDIANIVGELGKDLHSAAVDVEGMQYALDRLRTQASVPTAPTTGIRDSVVTAVQRVEAKQARIDSLVRKLDSRGKDLEDAYGRLVKKCSFTPSDDQGMQWGKIQRLLTNLRNTIRIRAHAKVEMERNRTEARRQGLPASTATENGGGAPVERMLDDIEDRLDEFVERNARTDPASQVYANSCKRFALLLSQGKVADVGILAIGTENDVPHPSIRVGDIVLSRKDRSVRFVSDFIAAKSAPGEDEAEVLRWDASGRRGQTRLELPAGSPRIGFLELRDADD